MLMDETFGGYFRHSLIASAAIVSVAAATPAAAQTRSFNVPAQDAASGVATFAKQADIQLLISARDASGKRTNAVRGNLTVEQGLQQLLANTGLRAQATGAQTYSVVSSTVGNGPAAETALSLGGDGSSENRQIVVTGTHLRAAAPTSPVITITRRDIDQTGATSVEDFMRKLPQNLSAGVAKENFAVVGTGQDITDHGAGMNLRGLGQRATLVLVNGRRVAPSGTGSFVDVSLLPLSAIDRVEVVTDGASAIYGSDAVAGVVNFILRDDFRGIETLAQVGTTTRGGGGQFLGAITGGAGWNGGHALLSYDFHAENEIKARDRDFTINLPSFWPLFPRERRHSLYGTAKQEIATGWQLELSGQYGARNTDRSLTSTGLLVNNHAQARAFGGTLALQAELGSSWRGEISGSYFRSKQRETSLFADTGGLFNRFNTTNSNLEFNGKADGNLFDVPAGSVKLALGASSRHESFSDVFESTVNIPKPLSLSRNVHAAYAETQVPIFGNDNKIVGFNRLLIDAAIRAEKYQRIGSSVNPKVGMLWSPSTGLNLRGSWGKSFRAPLIYESLGEYNVFLFPASLLYIDPSQAPDGVGAALIGNNPNVGPERSKSFTTGVEWVPPSVERLRLGATYYRITFSNRIARPVDQIVVIGDPSVEAIVTRDPDSSTVGGLFSGAGQVLDFSGPGFTNGGATPDDVVVVLDARTSNTAKTVTSGLDLNLDYGFSASRNEFRLIGNINRIFRFDDQLTSTSPPIHTLDTPFHPVGWRARGGLSWSRGPFSAVAFVNYTGSYEDRRAGRHEKVDSWTTVDTGLSYAPGPREAPFLRGLRVALNVENLFDVDPPHLLADPASTRDIGYDPVNASGRGRAISLQVRKSW
jgi:outer membrane receptor protein involved in Fe transport